MEIDCAGADFDSDCTGNDAGSDVVYVAKKNRTGHKRARSYLFDVCGTVPFSLLTLIAFFPEVATNGLFTGSPLTLEDLIHQIATVV